MGRLLCLLRVMFTTCVVIVVAVVVCVGDGVVVGWLGVVVVVVVVVGWRGVVLVVGSVGEAL